eukprot:2700560-Rhodomonas_salina.1
MSSLSSGEMSAPASGGADGGGLRVGSPRTLLPAFTVSAAPGPAFTVNAPDANLSRSLLPSLRSSSFPLSLCLPLAPLSPS